MIRVFYFLVAFSFVFSTPAFAEGKYYKQCLGKFDKYFSGEALQDACRCADKEVSRYQARKLTKEQYKVAVTACVANTMQVTLEKKSFVSCVQNPQFKSGGTDESYCSCLSEEYAHQMMDLGMLSISEGEERSQIHGIASKVAHDKCRNKLKVEEDQVAPRVPKIVRGKRYGK